MAPLVCSKSCSDDACTVLPSYSLALQVQLLSLVELAKAGHAGMWLGWLGRYPWPGVLSFAGLLLSVVVLACGFHATHELAENFGYESALLSPGKAVASSSSERQRDTHRDWLFPPLLCTTAVGWYHGCAAFIVIREFGTAVIARFQRS